MHVHRRLYLPNDIPRSVRTQEADDVWVVWSRPFDDDALNLTQFLSGAIQRELAAKHSLCQRCILVHLHADIWVSVVDIWVAWYFFANTIQCFGQLHSLGVSHDWNDSFG